MSFGIEISPMLERMFNPSSVTIVGASPRSTPAMGLLKNLMRPDLPYKGRIQLVNRTGEGIAGLDCWKGVSELPHPPGLVFLVISPERCLPTLEELRQMPEGVVIYAGGFKEAGNVSGEMALVEWSRKHGIPIIGPQSLGIVSVKDSFVCFTSPLPERVVPGPVGLAYQSGGMTGSTLRAMFSRGVGMAASISYGNAAVIGLTQAANACLDHPEVRILCLHAEGAFSIEDFAEIAVKARRLGTPVVLLASGTSKVGQRAAKSHTGALVTSPAIIRSIAEQYGVVLVDDADQMIWACEALTSIKGAANIPGKVGVVATSGGSAILLADAAERVGLDLIAPKDETRQRLAEHGQKDVLNPIDIGAEVHRSPEELSKITRAFSDDPTYGVIAMLAGVGLGEPGLPLHLSASEVFVKAVQQAGKVPFLAAVINQDTKAVPRWPGVPIGSGIGEVVTKLKALQTWLQFAPDEWSGFSKRSVTASEDEGRLVPENEIQGILKKLPVHWPEIAAADSMDQLKSLLPTIRYPVVLKTRAELPHKAKVGGVVVDVSSEDTLVAACHYLITKFRCGVNVIEQVSHEDEWILGFRRDPDFGNLVLFGKGGADIANTRFRRIPMTTIEITRLLGHYGEAASSLAPIITAIQKIVEEEPEIKTIDINPITIDAHGQPYVLDVKVYR